MRTLYLRIYLTVVAVLLVFALVSGFLFQRNIDSARAEGQLLWAERLAEWAEYAQIHLPAAGASQDDQRAALEALSQHMRVPLALDGADGQRIAASERFDRREADAQEGRRPGPRIASLPLADGRTLRVLRPGPRHPMRPSGAFGPPPFAPPSAFGWLAFPGAGIVMTLALLFAAISIGAYPVVRRLTRRLESLERGVEAFGAGALDRRVAEDGNDEVAAVGASFNRAAARIEALVRSHRSLLANASHELRSPLARMKMALAMLEDAPPARRETLRREIDTNIAELDALVEEVLLASRLDASQTLERRERVELLALAVEEAARFEADVDGVAVTVDGDDRLLRRALRNLLENARRYGGGEIALRVQAQGGYAVLRVCDRGPGVPEESRERIFEPFYRLPGHAELAGGVGLGLSLVKQIAERHGGSIGCEARDGGGSCFELLLPLA